MQVGKVQGGKGYSENTNREVQLGEYTSEKYTSEKCTFGNTNRKNEIPKIENGNTSWKIQFGRYKLEKYKSENNNRKNTNR